jgi:hypothetical protein
MLIGEVRKIIKKYSSKELQLIISEMYKSIPKSVKEDKDIDEIINNPDEFSKPKAKRIKKKIPLPDIEELQDDIEEFVGNAMAQNYYAPNRIIPKKERSKWRFIVKNFYKDLLASASVEENIPLASKLMEDIYIVLCHACSVYIFSSVEPFQSIGIKQTEFLKTLLILKSRYLGQKEFSRTALTLITDNPGQHESQRDALLLVLLDLIKTPDALETAFENCKELLTTPVKIPKAFKHRSDYHRRNRRNCLAEMLLLCSDKLHEIERGIKCFWKYSSNNNAEIKLFCLICILKRLNKKKEIILVYENALRKKIKPRESIEKFYKTIKETGELPKWI